MDAASAVFPAPSHPMNIKVMGALASAEAVESNAPALATLAEELDAFLARLLCGGGATFSGATFAVPCLALVKKPMTSWSSGERKTGSKAA